MEQTHLVIEVFLGVVGEAGGDEVVAVAVFKVFTNVRQACFGIEVKSRCFHPLVSDAQSGGHSAVQIRDAIVLISKTGEGIQFFVQEVIVFALREPIVSGGGFVAGGGVALAAEVVSAAKGPAVLLGAAHEIKSNVGVVGEGISPAEERPGHHIAGPGLAEVHIFHIGYGNGLGRSHACACNFHSPGLRRHRFGGDFFSAFGADFDRGVTGEGLDVLGIDLDLARQFGVDGHFSPFDIDDFAGQAVAIVKEYLIGECG